jgi:hypothetical protein
VRQRGVAPHGSATTIRWWPRLVIVAAVVVVVLPAVHQRDSFPLSTYPMYAAARPSVVTLPAAIGIEADGRRRYLPMAVVARTDDPLIAASLLRGYIRNGTAGALCAQIAARAPAGVVGVEVVEERHDVDGSARPAASLVDQTVHARCAVGP